MFKQQLSTFNINRDIALWKVEFMTSSTAIVTPLISSTFLPSVGVTHNCTGCSTWNSDESEVEETKGIITTVDDVKNSTFQRAISRLIFHVENCCLDRSCYFHLFYKNQHQNTIPWLAQLIYSYNYFIWSHQANFRVGSGRACWSDPVNPYFLVSPILIFGAHRTDGRCPSG